MIWGFPRITPIIIHLYKMLHYKPSILGYPHFWKPPDGGFHSRGSPKAGWFINVWKNPHLKGMLTEDTPILGNLHIMVIGKSNGTWTARDVGISRNSGNPWNFKTVGLFWSKTLPLQIIIAWSRKVQKSRIDELMKFESLSAMYFRERNGELTRNMGLPKYKLTHLFPSIFQRRLICRS